MSSARSYAFAPGEYQTIFRLENQTANIIGPDRRPDSHPGLRDQVFSRVPLPAPLTPLTGIILCQL